MPDAEPPAEMSLVANKLLLDIACAFELPDEQSLTATGRPSTAASSSGTTSRRASASPSTTSGWDIRR